MGEIININIGQCGIKLAQSFWPILEEQHQIDTFSSRGILNYFIETRLSYGPRAVYVDTDPRTLDSLPVNAVKVLQQKQTRGLYPRGRSANEAAEEAIDSVRRQLQQCDCPAGIQIFSGTSGGTSSGLLSQVIDRLTYQFPALKIVLYAVTPDVHVNINPLSIYNFSLLMPNMAENISLAVMMDNSAVGKRVKDTSQGTSQGISQGTSQGISQGISEKNNIQALNQCYGGILANLTAGHRFKGPLNGTLGKTLTNLVLFPRMHFVCPSVSKRNPQRSILSPRSSIASVCSLSNFLLTDHFINMNEQCFVAQVHLRQNGVTEMETNIQARFNLEKSGLKFTEWLLDYVTPSFSEQVTQEPSATLLLNSRHFSSLMKNLSQHFGAFFRKRAFLHSYLAEGMDDMEFTEAESNVNDLLSEYQPYVGFDDEEIIQESDEEIIQE